VDGLTRRTMIFMAAGVGACQAAHARPATPDYLLVLKAKRILITQLAGQEIMRYPILSYGENPIGHKWRRGDERTPQGDYTISAKHRSQKFQYFLRISYPNARDLAAARMMGVDPGGDIGIHGFPPGWELALRFKPNWTDGCIAVADRHAEELFHTVAIGTPIRIVA
jgi:murein L,D-transpeptidase YafK